MRPFSNIAILKVIFYLSIVSILNSCNLSSASLEMEKGRTAESKQKFDQAIKHFGNVIGRTPDSDLALEASRAGARVAFFETKNFDEAIRFYRHLVRFSKDEKERRGSQKSIAEILFSKKNSYKEAIEEYNKLLLIKAPPEELLDNRFNLAKAYFSLNNFEDAKNELEEALKVVTTDDKKFELLMFKASILFNTKKVQEAVDTYLKLIKDYPERSKAENVAMNVIVCYEEMEAFDKAIENLEALKKLEGSDEEFLELKISRLRERKENLPGARGLRK